MSVLFREDWKQGDAATGVGNSPVVTNEYAYWNPTAGDRVEDPQWYANSGTLWGVNGFAFNYKDPMDIGAPNAQSTNHNNNAVGRFVTKKSDFADNYAIRVWIQNVGLTVPSGVIDGEVNVAHDWDGVHIWANYQAENNLYYASINRRDGKVVIKRKKPGGGSNGGTYVDLSTYNNYAVPTRSTQYRIVVETINTSPLTVRIRLWDFTTMLAEGIDSMAVSGVAPLTSGSVGIRSDNCKWSCDKFNVISI